LANFTTISLDANVENNTTESYQALGAANTEVRWSGTGTGLLSTASASWPADIRPASTGNVAYTYAFTADTTGFGFWGGSATAANPPAFSNANYKWARWTWDALGTFASAPIFTAYDNTSDNSATSGILAGTAGDTGSYSYLKANLWGDVTSTSGPTAAPTNAPVVTDGAAGSVSPTAGANWATHYQALQGDTNYLTFPNTPAATTADHQSVIFALFNGPNEVPGTYTPQLALKYTWT